MAVLQLNLCRGISFWGFTFVLNFLCSLPPSLSGSCLDFALYFYLPIFLTPGYTARIYDLASRARHISTSTCLRTSREPVSYLATLVSVTLSDGTTSLLSSLGPSKKTKFVPTPPDVVPKSSLPFQYV